MLVKLNDMAVNDQVVIPLVTPPQAAAMSNKLTAELSDRDNNTWDLPNWYREA